MYFWFNKNIEGAESAGETIIVSVKKRRKSAQETLNEAITWHSAGNTHIPSKHSKDPTEKDLGKRFLQLVLKLSKKPEDPLYEKVIQTRALFVNKYESAEEVLCRVVIWSFDHEHRPSKHSQDLYEKDLGRKYGEMKFLHKSPNDPLYKRICALEALFENKYKDTQVNIDDAAKYYEENNNFEKYYIVNPRGYSFLINRKDHPDIRQRLIDAGVSRKALDDLNIDKRKRKALRRIKRLAKKLGYQPRLIANPQTKNEKLEKEAARYLHAIRSGVIRLDDAIDRQMYDEITSLPRYREYKTNENVAKLDDYVIDNEHRPPVSKYEEEEVVRLAQFGHRAMGGRVALTPVNKELIEEIKECPTYQEYMIENGHWPLR